MHINESMRRHIITLEDLYRICIGTSTVLNTSTERITKYFHYGDGIRDAL